MEYQSNCKICVVSAANKRAESQYLLTNPNKLAYCERHGYHFEFAKLEESEYVGDPHFSKYWLVEREIRKRLYGWVAWIDVDAWFNNQEIGIQDVIEKYAGPDTDLVIARDQGMLGCDERLFDCYVNTGVMFFRSSEGGLDLLRRYNALREDRTVRRMVEALTEWRDQPYMCLLAMIDESAKKRISIANHSEMNTFAQCGFSENTFICHLPSAWAKEYLAKCVNVKSFTGV